MIEVSVGEVLSLDWDSFLFVAALDLSTSDPGDREGDGDEGEAVDGPAGAAPFTPEMILGCAGPPFRVGLVAVYSDVLGWTGEVGEEIRVGGGRLAATFA